MRNYGAVWITLILLVLCTACSPQYVNAGRSQAQIPGTTLYSDDFSNPASGWGVWNRDGALVEYQSGTLRILVQNTQYDFWSVAGQNFSDVQVEVDSKKIAGPDDNDFGLICRYVDLNNFYQFMVSSDGYYGIAKMKNGQYSLIGADQLQFSTAIAQGGAANRLRADCVGTTLPVSYTHLTLPTKRIV